MSRRAAWKILLSCWFARMSRHCTSGSPASIIVANWRVKMTISFGPTPDPIWKLPSAPRFRTLTGFSCCWRRRFSTAAWLSASITPLRSSPVRDLASHAKSAIVGFSVAAPSPRRQKARCLHVALVLRTRHFGVGDAAPVSDVPDRAVIGPDQLAAHAVDREQALGILAPDRGHHATF